MENTGGLKVKWKIRVVTGPEAARLDARQAAAIRELLIWATQQQRRLTPAEPVPVAFTGRTSTLYLQDPAASLRRQLRGVRGETPRRAGSSPRTTGTSSPAAWTSKHRGHGTEYEQFPDIGIPRDGGLADLLTEAPHPCPGSLPSSARTSNGPAGTPSTRSSWKNSSPPPGCPLFATDEPIDVAGDQRHHRPGPPGQAGRRRMVPAADQGKSLARACASTPWPDGTSAPPPTGT